MREEQKSILLMLQRGELTVDEAEERLATLAAAGVDVSVGGRASRWARRSGRDARAPRGDAARWVEARLRLAGVDVDGADLRGTKLVDADLTDADLSGANLRDADLTGANLAGADLTG